jgi:hypothetical protein
MAFRVVRKIVIDLILLLSILLLWECNKNPVSSNPVETPGVSGVVYDTSGHPLDSVRVYCMYVFGTINPKVNVEKPICRISKVDTFGFALFQNLPNPFGNSTYLRFSLPTMCLVNISITDPVDGNVKYSFDDSLFAGLYQFYLYNLVDSLQLHNGPYEYSIHANNYDSARYNASKEMFVISDVGSPNVLTGANGAYYFTYNDAFVGDSVVVNTNDLQTPYTLKLGRSILLLFERKGFQSWYNSVMLNPNLQIHSDIILIPSGVP